MKVGQYIRPCKALGQVCIYKKIIGMSHEIIFLIKSLNIQYPSQKSIPLSYHIQSGNKIQNRQNNLPVLISVNISTLISLNILHILFLQLKPFPALFSMDRNIIPCINKVFNISFTSKIHFIFPNSILLLFSSCFRMSKISTRFITITRNRFYLFCSTGY